MNFSRKELIQTEITMNQMRNSVYGLVRFMEKNKIQNVKEKLRKMGQNIARTYINYWKPTETVTITNIKDVITTIYQKILNSAISIEVDQLNNEIIVKDHKCALCKYPLNNLEIAGCEVLIGMVSEFIYLINKEFSEPSSIFLEPSEVKESRTFGNKSCIQIFRYNIGKEE